MKRIILLSLVLALALAGSAYAQTAPTKTTLAAAVSDTYSTTVTVTSATGFTAGTTWLYVNTEQMLVRAVSGTTISVVRGVNGTKAMPHMSGAVVYVGPATLYRQFDPSGACTSTNEVYLPQIAPASGYFWNCLNSRWQGVYLGDARIEGRLPRTPVSNAAYTILPTDVVVAMTSLTAARTLTLPSASGLGGKYYVVVDESGQAGSYTITISGTINGSGSGTTINTAYGAVRLYSDGSNWFKW